MATKKCPKCGEENPAEAVMCWACYTPLAGGAAAAAGGGLVTPRGGAAAVTPAATAAAQDEEKKGIDPKIFLVVGLLLVAGVIGGFTSGIFGGSGNAETLNPDLPTNTGGGTTGSSGGIIPQQPSNPGIVAQPSSNSNSGAGSVTPQAAPFRMVVPPDPRYSNGTMAIIPTAPNVSPAQASGLAKYAKQMVAPGGRWKSMQVVVFNNPGAAKAFQKYQASRKGAKLSANDYAALAGQGVWSGAPAYYETQGNSEQSFQPSANPNNWWTSRGR